MTLSLVWMVMLYITVMFTLESSMFSALVYMFVMIFLGSGIMATVSGSVWMSMIFLIFMIGGLMVSFFYMVSLTHNMVFSISPLVLFISVCLVPFSLASLGNFHNCLDYFLFSSPSYLVVVLFMLFLLFLILFMIDFKLKAMKGFLKGI
uniref:NADH dehydrogenase subunit 6 n=1 Tax=Liposcelis bostrychophila TaxID=185214 RepID=H9M5L5_LIPBO|nr:NADH dehydrogenase subunit 6 [Liposcelis bostrychophila]ATU74615.1 NADH dehydrogenase subunit 6 [Liposcelis bostrychophila]ATU74628.1 NADH dehydrogenase subunit 6 [Liposcelis bostrychophila]